MAGPVTPGHVRADLDGRILERVVGVEDVAVRLTCDGGTRKTAVAP